MALNMSLRNNWTLAVRVNSAGRTSPNVPANYSKIGTFSFFGNRTRPPCKDYNFIGLYIGKRFNLNHTKLRWGFEVGPAMTLIYDPVNFRLEGGFLFPPGYVYDSKKSTTPAVCARTALNYSPLRKLGCSAGLSIQANLEIISLGAEFQVVFGKIR
jgi:hypothetical protein